MRWPTARSSIRFSFARSRRAHEERAAREDGDPIASSTTSWQTLVINSGSSSLKFALIEAGSGRVTRQGLAERLGTASARLRTHSEKPIPGAGHAEALEEILAQLGGRRPDAVGHRVVHGGEAFSGSVVLDDDAVKRIRACNELAPLHNPANLLGIEIARRKFPTLQHVAVFDTAFHQTLPAKAFMYAVPYELYERHRVRRYGFHGTSHAFVAGQAADRIGKPLDELQLVTAHLGNGCSACAIKGGRSVDTTMGLTPLEGLVMGTRSGDVDPNLHQFLADQTGRSLGQITDLLNRESGLLGLSGSSNDMRVLLEARGRGDARASLALDVFCYRLAKALLGLCAALERIDALVFTGGIGEHAAAIRAETLAQLRVLGPVIDPARNATHGAATGGRISADLSPLLCLVIPTNEELVIARETARLLDHA
jgi:acetate kinase